MNLGYPFYSQLAAAADGMLFFTNGHEMTARSAANGTLLWRNKVLPNGNLAIVNGTIYATKVGGNLMALAESNGTVLWERDCNVSGEAGYLAVENDTIYMALAGDDGTTTVMARARRDGAELWRREYNNNSGPRLAVGGGLIFVPYGGVRALYGSNGTVAWESQLAPNTILVLSDGLLFFETLDIFEPEVNIMALHAGNGTICWSHSGPACNYLAAGDGHLLVMSWNGLLLSYDMRTGEYEWDRGSAENVGFGQVNIVLADAKILLSQPYRQVGLDIHISGSGMSTSYSLPPKLIVLGMDGTDCWEYEFPPRTPAAYYGNLLVMDGRIFVVWGNYGGNRTLVAFGQNRITDDLSIEASLSPARNLESGDNLTAFFTIKNRGNSEAINVSVVMNDGINGGGDRILWLPRLGAGETYKGDYSWVLDNVDDFPVYVTVEAERPSVEADGGNNIFIFNASSESRPDYEFDIVNIPMYINRDGTLEIDLWVTDARRTDETRNVVVELYSDGTFVERMNQTILFSTSFNWMVQLTPAAHDIVLRIDPQNEIDEVNETNNELHRRVLAPGLVPPLPEPVAMAGVDPFLIAALAVAVGVSAVAGYFMMKGVPTRKKASAARAATPPQKTVIVLAMHGAPALDFPKDRLAELTGLHHRLEGAVGPAREALEKRQNELDGQSRNWPRNPGNDPFWASSHVLAGLLRQKTGNDVVLGFNEFCAPGLDEALDRAVELGAGRIIIVTPMMTPGGEHSGKDIPEAIRRARERSPSVRFDYAWPFDQSEVAAFLADRIKMAGTGAATGPKVL
jgi:sirohydrochlorin cobaltochelatase